MPEVVETNDGSKTLYSPRYQQTYHSIHGALTESQHVFVQSVGLAERLAQSNDLHILEIGFGTGLNYLLASQLAKGADTPLRYTALEQRFLPSSLLAELEYGTLLNIEKEFDMLLAYLNDSAQQNNAPQHTFCFEQTTLHIFTALDLLLNSARSDIDVVFLDAFSPEKNPELWSPRIIQWLYAKMNNGSALATYTAKGDVRRSLISAGFAVERLPGPPGKRHMLLATK